MKTIKNPINLLILFCLFILIITILFLWKEQDIMNFNFQINNEKFGNYFGSIGAIGTIFALSFLYLQLKEMENQRIDSIKPDLYPLTTMFSMKEIKDGNDKVHIYPKDIDNEIDTLDSFMIIKNIGLGAAKCISLKWEYDLNEIEKIILDKYYNQKPEVLESEIHDVIIKEGEIKIKPPYYYLACCGSKMDPDFFDRFEVVSKNKPKLKLNLTYRTIGNTLIKSNFNVEIEAYENNVTFKFSGFL